MSLVSTPTMSCLGRTGFAVLGCKWRMSLRILEVPICRCMIGIDRLTIRTKDFEPMPLEIEKFGRTLSNCHLAADVIFQAREDFVDPPILRGGTRGAGPQGKLTFSPRRLARCPAPARGTTAGLRTAPDVAVSLRECRGTAFQFTESPPVLRRTHGRWLQRTPHCRCLQGTMSPPAGPGTGKCRSFRREPSRAES